MGKRNTRHCSARIVDLGVLSLFYQRFLQCSDTWGRTFSFRQIPVLKDADISFHLSVTRVKHPFPHNPTFQCLILFELQEAGLNCGPRPRETPTGQTPTAGGPGRHLGADRLPCPGPAAVLPPDVSLLWISSPPSSHWPTWRQLSSSGSSAQISTPRCRFGRREKLRFTEEGLLCAKHGA